jgi:hypothetical protein
MISHLKKDMCLDLIIGEDTSHTGHNLTGLLSPLLLAVAAVLMILIAVIDYLKKKWKKYWSRRNEKQSEKSKRRMSLAEKTIRRMSLIPDESDLITRNDLSQVFYQADKRGSIWENRVHGRLVRLSDVGTEFPKSFHNPAYVEDDQNEDTKSSLDTLKHLLNSKPWVPFNQKIDEEPEITRPEFFLKTQ